MQTMMSRNAGPLTQNVILVAVPLFLAACTLGGDEISAFLGLLGFLIFKLVGSSSALVPVKEDPTSPGFRPASPPSSPNSLTKFTRNAVETLFTPQTTMPRSNTMPTRPLISPTGSPPSQWSRSATSPQMSVLGQNSPMLDFRQRSGSLLSHQSTTETSQGSDRSGTWAPGRPVAVMSNRGSPTAFKPDSMDEHIRKMLKVLRPPHPSHRQYVKGIVANVHAEIQTVLPLAKLFAFGSSFNGFGDRDAGIDLALILDSVALERMGGMDPMLILKKVVFPALRDAGYAYVEESQVPFARICVTEPKDGTLVNISVNTLLPMVNTKFLRQYALIDRRVHELVLIVKRWARARGLINDGADGLSSYAWTLMVIFFLQNEGVLPSLQALAKTAGHGKSQSWLQEVPSWKQMLMRDENIDRRLLHFVDQAHCKTVWSSDAPPAENAQLLARFFEFYTMSFEWEKEIISVRLGHRVDQRTAGTLVQGELCIEDPLDLTSNVNTSISQKRLREEFTRAAQMLDQKTPLRVFLQKA